MEMTRGVRLHASTKKGEEKYGGGPAALAAVQILIFAPGTRKSKNAVISIQTSATTVLGEAVGRRTLRIPFPPGPRGPPRVIFNRPVTPDREATVESRPDSLRYRGRSSSGSVTANSVAERQPPHTLSTP